MKLHVVATPIGNLKDITIRAREVLAEATLILAEDTRSIKKLLTLLEIPLGGKEFVASHAQSAPRALERAIEGCRDHKSICLVTDAGTPAISDPGSLFIATFRGAYPEAMVVPVPGVSAVTAALSVAGFPGNHFEFLGFVPHKKGRQTFFETVATTKHTVVFYESPHRIMKTLESLALVLDQTRKVMVAREMTKAFEEYPVDTATTVLDYYRTHPDKVRGEFVVVVAPSYTHAISSDTIE